MNRQEIDDYGYLYAPIAQILMDFTKTSDKSHDSLMRCRECGVKHDIHDLTRLDVGYFVCKFCLRKGA